MKVASLDLSKFRRGDRADRRSFQHALLESYRGTGFVRLHGHGIHEEVIRRAQEAVRRFHELPEEAKRRYVSPSGDCQRGFTPFGTEHAKDRPDRPDLKEFDMVGPEIPDSHPMRRFYPRNLWPDEVPEFQAHVLALRDALEDVALTFGSALSLALCQPEDWLPSLIREGDTTLRPIWYPSMNACRARLGSAFEGCLRSAPHEDISMLTLLPVALGGGLEIRVRDAGWQKVGGEAGELVVNAGDILQHLTAGFIPSTTHRVVNPVGDDDAFRIATPLFVHPVPTALLRVPETLWRLAGAREEPEPVHARTKLNMRLVEIGNLPPSTDPARWLKDLAT